MSEEERQNASGGDGADSDTSAAGGGTPDSQPKVEVKDGVVTVDGKKYVLDSDLIAAKKSLEGQAEAAQQVHNEAVDKLKLDVSSAQQATAQANAALEEAKKAGETGGTSEEEVSRIKTGAEEATANLTKANESVLELKRQLLMQTYNITPDSETGQSLATKDLTQLGSFEEALKALASARGGPGNYAVGGGGGDAAPKTEMDRARDILAATPVRGTRNPTSE